MDTLQLLKFLKTNGETTLKKIMSEFEISRTATLYHIRLLLKRKLITATKKEKQFIYALAERKTLTTYYANKIKQLEKDLSYLTTESKKTSARSTDKKPVLSIVNFYELQTQAKEELLQYYTINDYSDTQLYISNEEFIERAKEAEVVLNNYATERITAEVLDQLPKLKYMHLSTHMSRYVDLSACKERNIRISNLPYEYKSLAVTEYLLAQTFALLRDVVPASIQVQSGVNDFRYFKGEQLAGKKAVIFGVGQGTKSLSERLKALGVEVVIYTEDKTQDPAYYGMSRFATADEVFETGDLFYVAWAGDEEKDLIGNLNSSFLKRISRPVYIISVYKHRHVDFKQLRELMYAGLIRGIAFDYYPDIFSGDSRESEASALLYLPKVIITPDIAWHTQTSIVKMNQLTNERLVAYAQGINDYFIA